MKMLADRSRLINGKHASLADIGYSDAGIDDGWQKCGNYGPEKYKYHNAAGDPVIDGKKFPDLQHLTALAHGLNLTAGWYGNACGCAAQPYPQCCSDHCDTLECFAGDINATVSFGFDSYKIDGCGAQRDIELWANMFNHSLTVKHGQSPSQAGMMIENCHDGDGDSPGANAPYYKADGELWCPFHTYRTSGDARPTFGSLLNNLNSTRAMAAGNLSVPGCWAYADMMEIGVTATGGLHDCGPNGTDTCGPLTVTEARSHFGAWAIVSSPLVLGFDLRNETMLRLHWDTITNLDAIEVNQDYAGDSGSQFAQSTDKTTLHGCDWKAGVSCDWPSWTAWYKPLSHRDIRGSEMAVLLINNAYTPQKLSFSWTDVPGLASHGQPTSCVVYDVWQQKPIGTATGSGFTTADPVPSRDSAFITFSCEH